MGKVFTICVILTIALAAVACVFGLGYLSYSMNDMGNQNDVLAHMGLTIVVEKAVPDGQTVKFYINPTDGRPSDFNTFLQFIEMYKPDVIHFVEKKLNFVNNYDGCALYFIHDGIIYLYR